MALYLITYELSSNEVDKDDDLVETIEYYTHQKLTKTSYLIETKVRPHIVFHELKRYLQAKDTLLMFKVKLPWYGQGHMDTIDWVARKI
ncbi:MAG: hypothetical protein ACE5G1_03235 [bacterium]